MDQDLVGPRINALDLYRDPLEAVEDPHVEVPASLATAHATLGPIADGHDFEVLIVDREPGVPVAPQRASSAWRASSTFSSDIAHAVSADGGWRATPPAPPDTAEVAPTRLA
jgi:hypothetical protein